MIFRIVEDATGQIVMSVDCDETLARLYLKPGQSLMRGGDQLMIDDSRLYVTPEGAVAQRPYVGLRPNDQIAGEGDVLTLVETMESPT